MGNDKVDFITINIQNVNHKNRINFVHFVIIFFFNIIIIFTISIIIIIITIIIIFIIIMVFLIQNFIIDWQTTKTLKYEVNPKANR